MENIKRNIQENSAVNTININDIVNSIILENNIDTRYIGGCYEVYEKIAIKFGANPLLAPNKSEEFVNKYKEWHENNRHNFKLHPNWESIINE